MNSTQTWIAVGIALLAALAAACGGGAGQPAGPDARANVALPRTADGKPDLSGIWQTMNAANWDLEPHSAEDGIPGGLGVVDGGTIPYRPEALAQRDANRARRAESDPVVKCFAPGIPRATYVPLPFQIIQTPNYITMNYEFGHWRRVIYTDGSPHVEALDFWMGDSRATWEGDTLVVDVIDFNDRSWFDNAGNYHSDKLHVVERFTMVDVNHMNYEATIEDPQVFTAPWRISMPIYRRLEPNLQIIDYDCVSHFWKRQSVALAR